MTTIEILQAAIDDQCDIEIETTAHGIVHVYFGSPINAGWAADDTLETAVASAWHHYQTNKKQ